MADDYSFLAGGGEMGQRLRSHDWTATAIGPPKHWPQPLRTLVSVMLGSNQAMFALWGPDHALLYNDRYAEILGQKHPKALGQPFLKVWEEIVDDLTPLVDRAYAGESIYMDDIHLIMHRHGYPEETHFDFSYTPIRDERGDVAGVFCPCTEITDKIQAERRLRKSEKRFRQLADAMPQLVWTANADGVVEYYNSRVQDFAGIKQDADGNWQWQPALHAEDEDRTIAAWQNAITTGGIYACEHRIRMADGSMRWHLSRATPMTETDGTIKWFGTATDVHDLKIAQEALRENEERFRLVNLATNDLIYDWDMVANHLDWNDAIVTQFGYTKEQFGSTIEQWENAIHPQDQKRVVKGMEAAINGGRDSWSAEYRFRKRDGSYAMFLDRGYIARDDTGTAYRMIGSMFDLTERHQAEEALRESEQRFRMMADTAPAMLWITDRDNQAVFLSRGWFEYTGQSEDHALGLGWTQAVHPEDRERAIRTFLGAAENTEPFSFDYRLRRHDGQYRWAIDAGRPRFSAKGEWLGYIGSVFDVHDRKLAEEDLRRSRDELEQRVRERTIELQHRADQLVRLTSQLTLTEHRERQRLAKILHDHLQQILVGASFRLAILAKHLPKNNQDVAQLESLLNESINASRSLTVELSPPILHEAGLSAGLNWLARSMKDKHGLAVELNVDDFTPIDRDDIKLLIYEVVRELLLNVAKHAGVKQVVVSLSQYDNQQLRVVVEDQGVGFDFKAVISDTDPERTSFGLFSIRERLDHLGGRMEVDSAIDRGTRFTLFVPLLTDQASPAVPGSHSATLHTGVSEPFKTPAAHATDGSSIRVLIVDDHAVMRQGLGSLLEAEPDIEVVGQAADGIEAVAGVRQLCPDVILMDFSMPQMDGVEATRIIHAGQPHIRIIGLSMYAEEDRAKAMIEAGAAVYLTKTGQSHELLTAIRQFDPAILRRKCD
ncbi:PAS domain S-box protein [Phycisphaerales bacterium AB-hyl4]|uniref:histidine kinase n=1 Tax=Natronomicrosphaera hydrolytica TaxID=3242702 RepID=A0ABV4U5B3_9BACT